MNEFNILFQKKNDREEIRKRLVDGYHNTRKSTKKSSLEYRLQNGTILDKQYLNLILIINANFKIIYLHIWIYLLVNLWMDLIF